LGRQESIIAGKLADVSRENEALKQELYRVKEDSQRQLSQQQQQISSLRSSSSSSNNNNSAAELAEATRKIQALETACEQLEETLNQERLNHKEYVMSTHKKFEKICEERASADAKARSYEVRLGEMTRQCEQLAHEKDLAISSAERNSPQKVCAFLPSSS
jgi:chromosome segregation ATPase